MRQFEKSRHRDSRPRSSESAEGQPRRTTASDERFDGPVWIGVWSENHKARRFYGRYGFEKCGEYDFAVGETRDHEFILMRG